MRRAMSRQITLFHGAKLRQAISFGKTLSTSGDVTASGNVSATGAVSAAQYKIGPNLILSAPGTNTIMGVGAGTAAGSSAGNSLFGLNAGSVNTGQNNSVFGAGANTWGMGSNNAYFGADAGFFGAGNENSYFGRGAGKATFTNNLTTLIGAGTGVLRMEPSMPRRSAPTPLPALPTLWYWDRSTAPMEPPRNPMSGSVRPRRRRSCTLPTATFIYRWQAVVLSSSRTPAFPAP